jgi:hypothetical protein
VSWGVGNPQRGALGGGKITHLPKIERGAWLRRWEGATNKRGAPKRDVRVLGELELVRRGFS